MIMQCLFEEGNQFHFPQKLIEDTKIMKFSDVQMFKLCDSHSSTKIKICDPSLANTFPKSVTPLKLEGVHAMSYL